MNSALLKKYFEGKCSPEEEAMVMQYLQQENLDALHEHITAVEQEAKDEVPAAVSDELLDNIHQQIAAKERRVIMMRVKRWRVAAGIIMAVSVLGAFWLSRQRGAVQEEEWLSISNTEKDVKKVQMPDGTQIWLNAKSAIAYHEKAYNNTEREVRVSGEVFFDVAGDPGKPFRVSTGKVTTTVLGTAFNIEHYAYENDIRVTLVQGKVEVAADSQKYILSPGQMMRYNVQAHTMEVRSTDADRVDEWVKGRLVFNDVALADVLKRMEKTYEISIVCLDASLLEGKRLTGTYDRKKPEEVLRKILFVHGLHYEKQPGEFIITH